MAKGEAKASMQSVIAIFRRMRLGITSITVRHARVDEIDIYRAAKLLVDQYGADAPVQAAMRAGVMIERGDMAGAAVWKRVMRAIAELQTTERRTRH